MSEKVVVTVIGKDRTGIVATISTALAELNVNIEDFTSTRMQDMFIMLILADISNAKVPFKKIRANVIEAGKKIGMRVLVQHENIFKQMHRI